MLSMPFEFEILVNGDWKEAIVLGEYHPSLTTTNGAFCLRREEDEDGQRLIWVRTRFRRIDDNTVDILGNGFEPSFHFQPSIVQWRRSPTRMITANM